MRQTINYYLKGKEQISNKRCCHLDLASFFKEAQPLWRCETCRLHQTHTCQGCFSHLECSSKVYLHPGTNRTSQPDSRLQDNSSKSILWGILKDRKQARLFLTMVRKLVLRKLSQDLITRQSMDRYAVSNFTSIRMTRSHIKKLACLRDASIWWMCRTKPQILRSRISSKNSHLLTK